MHYVRNADLTRAILACQKTNVLSAELLDMLLLMIVRYSQKPNWRHYSYIEDMRSEAILQLVKYGKDGIPNVLKFDIGYSQRKGTSPNPFAYVTQIVSNVFKRFVKTENAVRDFRDDMLIRVGMVPSHGRQVTEDLARSSEPIPVKVRGRKKKATT